MASKFEFPSFYFMAPMYTIQPTLTTRKKQFQLWGELILDYSKINKKYEYDVTEASKTPLFNNAKINRKLSPEAIRQVFDGLVEIGNAEWQGQDKNRISIYWRRPEEWGSLIYKWVSDSGKLNSVFTVFEIQQGEEAEGQEFYELEIKMLLKALRCLEKQKMAQIFTGNSEENLGVKFFSV